MLLLCTHFDLPVDLCMQECTYSCGWTISQTIRHDKEINDKNTRKMLPLCSTPYLTLKKGINLWRPRVRENNSLDLSSCQEGKYITLAFCSKAHSNFHNQLNSKIKFYLFWVLFCFSFCFVFWDRISLRIFGWLGAQYADPPGLKLTKIYLPLLLSDEIKVMHHHRWPLGIFWDRVWLCGPHWL